MKKENNNNNASVNENKNVNENANENENENGNKTDDNVDTNSYFNIIDKTKSFKDKIQTLRKWRMIRVNTGI